MQFITTYGLPDHDIICMHMNLKKFLLLSWVSGEQYDCQKQFVQCTF